MDHWLCAFFWIWTQSFSTENCHCTCPWSSHATPFRCTPSFNALRIVASVYNRALRRVAGTPRFERDEHALSDLEVRRTLTVTSYDCILMQNRLRYVGRIVRTRPTTLVAMLSIRTGATCPSRVVCESAGGLALYVEKPWQYWRVRHHPTWKLPFGLA